MTRFKHNLKWQVTANIIQLVLGGAFIFTLGFATGSTLFGELSILLGFGNVIVVLSDFRLYDIISSKGDTIEEKFGKTNFKKFVTQFLYTDLIVKILISFIAISLLTPLLNFLGLSQLKSKTLLIITILVTILSKVGVQILFSYLRQQSKVNQITLIVFIDGSLKLLAIIALYLLKCSSIHWYILLPLFSSTIVNLITLWKNDLLTLPKIHDIQKSFSLHSKDLFSGWIISLSDLYIKDLDVLALSQNLTPSQIGIYKMSKNLAFVLWRLFDPLYSIIFPELPTLLSQNTKHRAVRILLRISILLLIISSITLILYYFIGIPLINNILSTKFENIGLHSFQTSIWILPVATIMWTGGALYAINKSKQAALSSLASLALGILLFQKCTTLSSAILVFNICITIPFAINLLTFIKSYDGQHNLKQK